MPEDKSVNVLDSLDDINQNGKSQSDEGKSPSAQEIEKKVRENLRAEYERKSNEKVEAEKAKITESYEARITELEGKDRLTGRESTELEALQKSVYEIQSDPKFKPWDHIINERVNKVLDERDQKRWDAMHKQSQGEALKLFESTAKELKMTKEEFDEEVTPFLEDKYLNLLPVERLKRAISDMNRIKAKYSKTEKKDDGEFNEGEGRQQRKVSTKEALTEARQSGNFKNILSQVASNQEEARKK